MDNFRLFGLPDAVIQSLELMSFHKPTPIQAQTIPSALEGSDILGSAQTGTGKTGAYGIPLATHLLKNTSEMALVLTPTRELALQVFETLKQLVGRKSSVNAALLIGGDSMHKQLRQLKSRPRLIVGTPGRVNDHLARKSLNLSTCNFLVLDETDRMLDMGFSIQLQKILEFLPAKRQTLMFSATMSSHIVRMAESYLINPVRISVGSPSAPVEKIKQEIIKTTENEKYTALLGQLEQQDGSCIIFVKTKIGTEKLATRLRVNGHSVDAIHGDLRQNKRLQIIKSFRNGDYRLLVATDVAARGLDIPHIECVVNYDLPQCPEDYIHRIGRTGRAGAVGKAISFITSQDHFRWKSITNLIENKTDDSAEPQSFKRSGPKRSSDFKNSYRRSSQSDFKSRPKKTYSQSFEGRESVKREYVRQENRENAKEHSAEPRSFSHKKADSSPREHSKESGYRSRPQRESSFSRDFNPGFSREKRINRDQSDSNYKENNFEKEKSFRRKENDFGRDEHSPRRNFSSSSSYSSSPKKFKSDGRNDSFSYDRSSDRAIRDDFFSFKKEKDFSFKKPSSNSENDHRKEFGQKRYIKDDRQFSNKKPEYSSFKRNSSHQEKSSQERLSSDRNFARSKKNHGAFSSISTVGNWSKED